MTPTLENQQPARSTDVVLVGAGPIGLELAVCLQHAGVDVVHLDAGQVGQTVADYPKQTRYFSSPDRIAIAGVPLSLADQAKASREQYLTYLHGVVEQFDLPIQTYEAVKQINRNEDTGRFTVVSAKAVYDARYVVLAIGDMHHPRLLDIPGEDLPHVSHYLDEPQKYFRQNLLIVGGKNSAVEAALRCQRAGARVTMSYRGETFDPDSIKYWLLPEINALIEHGQIAFHPRTIPTRITPDAVTLAPSATGLQPAGDLKALPPIDADFVLLLTGYTQDKTLFESAGVTLVGENRAPQHDPATMMTDVPNLYVAGTAAAGTQNAFKLYIENSHPHVTKIVTAITGTPPPARLVNTSAKTYGLAES
ncbi:MAG: NAD(P)-binding domain-containing protein [Planctomycetota bacterium]